MNTFQDMEHALLTGVVVGVLKKAGFDAAVMLNSTDDTTPYVRLVIEGTEAVIVVLPRE